MKNNPQITQITQITQKEMEATKRHKKHKKEEFTLVPFVLFCGEVFISVICG